MVAQNILKIFLFISSKSVLLKPSGAHLRTTWVSCSHADLKLDSTSNQLPSEACAAGHVLAAALLLAPKEDGAFRHMGSTQ